MHSSWKKKHMLGKRRGTLQGGCRQRATHLGLPTSSYCAASCVKLTNNLTIVRIALRITFYGWPSVKNILNTIECFLAALTFSFRLLLTC